MKIRKYRKTDKEQVKELVISALEEVFKTAKHIGDLDNIETEYEVFLVVEKNGEIIGTLGIINKGDAKIKRMYVKKSERRRGIGTALMEKVFQYCKGKFKRIFLSTYPEMKAEGFYEKFGFKEFKRDNKIWMEKKLE
jgi:GNAT superfamily N-acetyltransferase